MLALKGSPRTTPWPHLYLRQVFTDSAYEQLLLGIPDLEFCTPLEGYEGRLFWPLPLGGMWSFVVDALCSPELTKALSQQLGVTRSVYPKGAVCRDLPGYEIPSHIEPAHVVMKLIIFLTLNMEQKFFGPKLLIGEDGMVGKQIGFFPNVGFVYKSDANTWTSAGPMDSVRNTLQICYFDAPTREWK